MSVPAVKFPQAPFVDPVTGYVSRPWQQWLLNPQFISLTIVGVIGVDSGGTGLGTIPAPGDLLIGTGTGYALGPLTGTVDQISITNAPGSITLSIAASYKGQSSITTLGTITSGIWNGGTIGANFGGTGINAYVTGDILYAAGSTSLGRLPAAAAGNVLVTNGVGVAPSWGQVNLSTSVTGTLPPAQGGTGFGAYTVGDLLVADTGSTLAKLSDVATGQVLRAGGVGALPAYGPVVLTTDVTGVLPIANGGGLSGTWTPTLTSVANIDATTAYQCGYSRVGDRVTFSGKIAIDPTALGTVTRVGISLPIASNFANDYNAAGVANAAAINASAGIYADATNHRLMFEFVATDTSNQIWWFVGTYQVI